MKYKEDIRNQILSKVKKIVVKIGTGVLTTDDGYLDKEQIKNLAGQAVELNKMGYHVVVVSSGAIGSGMGELGIEKRPATLPDLQAVAAVGQSKLISMYDDCFKIHGYHAAQILLTREDFEERQRYLNTCNTIHALFQLNAIPVVNENDTISVDEIKFGDNDALSALVTNLLNAELLIILSSVDGLYDKYPTGKGKAAVIPMVENVSDEIRQLAFDLKTKRGVGGMQTKLEAAAVVTNAGEAVIIANGRTNGILKKIVQGEDVGTLFLPKEEKLASRKRWIGYTIKPKGKIYIDDGAMHALRDKGKSLLASGIVSVEGTFNKGDIISICGKGNGVIVARGLTNYSSAEIEKIKGCSTSHIAKVLGYKLYDEVIHRDNMVIL
ncbi:MAG: glutamate 5-kinase [Candidatus Brocadia sp. AMX2]|nr:MULTISPECIES: glutamate 5-kinase [Brocadia]MBC6932846.1 glutamate 5-kinase [Candidatus Brocadia sp.]MBL1167668.1 glutamate 5-kinase [Candidatus Brocadia sp. AMX1]MCK6467649.1 glutamate 5-kinase [Candidatus Brocadia sinica]NOG40439.1 glutamate 5-kinase [Planctomycetota bacterium]KAA0242128.1 MAG: glutamate 5-kinase [Candidatus Brocadia sp. AMX2]